MARITRAQFVKRETTSQQRGKVIRPREERTLRAIAVAMAALSAVESATSDSEVTVSA